eukprot:gene20700-24859_t
MKAIGQSGGSEKMFNNAVKTLQNILGISRHLSIAEIAKEFNQMGLVEQTENLLNIYKQKLLAGDRELQNKYVDFLNAEYTSAAFYVMASQNMVKMDSEFKKTLLNFSKCESVEFMRIVESIKDNCYGKEKPKVVQLKIPRKSASPTRLLSTSTSPPKTPRHSVYQ